MLESIWISFSFCGTSVKHDQEQVPHLQTSNCSTTSRTDSLNLGHEDKARSPFRIYKTEDRQMLERPTELRAEERFATSLPTLPWALPKRGHIPQSHTSRCSNASQETNLTEITAGLHFLLFSLIFTVKSSSGSRPK